VTEIVLMRLGQNVLTEGHHEAARLRMTSSTVSLESPFSTRFFKLEMTFWTSVIALNVSWSFLVRPICCLVSFPLADLMCMCVSVCVGVFMCVCVCVCMNVCICCLM
jgi:hypothetical protein